MTDDKLWTARELARFLGYSETTIARMVSQAPEKLPPRIEGLSRPRWLPSAAMEWIKGRVGVTTTTQRGRPRSRGF